MIDVLWRAAHAIDVGIRWVSNYKKFKLDTCIITYFIREFAKGMEMTSHFTTGQPMKGTQNGKKNCDLLMKLQMC